MNVTNTAADAAKRRGKEPISPQLERAYSLMSGGVTTSLRATPAGGVVTDLVEDPVSGGDAPVLGPDELAAVEESFEVDPETTVEELRSAWDPDLTEDHLRTALAEARTLIDRTDRILPVLEAHAALRAAPAALPAGFGFPGMDLVNIPIDPENRRFESVGDLAAWIAFGAFPALFRGTKEPFPDHRAAESRFEYRLQEPSPGHPLEIAIFADFGTGLYHSRYIAKQFQTRAVPYAIHLGDVYYAGRRPEFSDYFEAPLAPIFDSTELFMLNSNHEMFSGGRWYFELLRRKRSLHAIQKQEGSYFSLANERVQIVGIDTAYHKLGRFPKAGLQEWLRARLNEGRSAGRINILLSADHPYEYGKNEFTKLFAEDLGDLTRNGLIDLWFWGNTHYCALFEPTVTARFIGSCVGHGGFPYTTKRKGRFSVAPVRFIETRPRFPEWTRLRPDMGNNGYCLMKVHADGGLTLEYIDWMSNPRCTAQLHRDRAGGPLVIGDVVEHTAGA
jgi:hypothetical protein